MIEIKQLSKAYDRAVVVDGVDLTLPERGVTSIIGANGAGKSTLLSMVARLLKADDGSVSIDGRDIAQTPDGELAQVLSILRQENHFAVRLTVGELVAFGRYPYSKGRLSPADHRIVTEALAFLELQDLAGRYLDQLSGGQRQRAFVAMVLAQDTKYVLLDEPLNNLDLKHSVAMMKVLRRAAGELGRTIVMVVHDINFASAYSDTIIAMKDGRVLAQGSAADIITEPVLSEVYDVDVAVHDIAGQRVSVYFRDL